MPAPYSPVPLTPQRSLERNAYKAEELVEFLHASVGGNEKKFDALIFELVQAIYRAAKKQKEEGEYTDKSEQEILTRQYDAAIDMLYFVMGTFVEIGLIPEPGFNIVQEANMGKLDENGEPIIRESDNKIMKPKGWEEKYAPEPKLRAEVARQIALSKAELAD